MILIGLNTNNLKIINFTCPLTWIPQGHWVINLLITTTDILKDLDAVIAGLKKALQSPITVPKGIAEAVKNPYGMVLASKTLHPVTMANHIEQCAQKAAVLGKDIQMIFIDMKNAGHLSAFLKEQELEGKLAVLDIDALRKAVLINQLASHTLADFASRSKLAKIAQHDSCSQAA